MGGLILIATVIIWFLSYYPRTELSTATAETHVASEIASAKQSENSYLGQLGKCVEPVMQPMGLDWKASVAIITGASAKEITVSTLGVLYAVDDTEHSETNLKSKLVASGDYTPQSALAMIVFVLLYCPCIATIAAIAREAGGWKWALFSVVYSTALAWVLAFAAYHIGGLLGL